MCVEGDGHIKQLFATFCPCDEVTDLLFQDPGYLVDVLRVTLSSLGKLVCVSEEAVGICEGILWRKETQIINDLVFVRFKECSSLLYLLFESKLENLSVYLLTRLSFRKKPAALCGAVRGSTLKGTGHRLSSNADLQAKLSRKMQ